MTAGTLRVESGTGAAAMPARACQSTREASAWLGRRPWVGAAVVAVLAMVSAVAKADGKVAWPTLSYDGQGYWSRRLPVVVRGAAVAGTELIVRADGAESVLVGAKVGELRVADADGTELLFDLLGPGAFPKHEGTVRAGDVLVLPGLDEGEDVSGMRGLVTADAPDANGAAKRAVGRGGAGTNCYYVYWGNADAWTPPEWLGGTLVNTGFEVGDGSPRGWDVAEIDAAHRMTLDRDDPHGGDVCARCDVDEGAPATWVKYGQWGPRLVPGARYRFRAWVKAHDVKGRAGWFVHVHVGGQLVINRTVGHAGTYGWRPIDIEFTAPAEGAPSFACGTSLYGTGRAWYDDVELVRLDEGGASRIACGAVESRELKTIGADAPWPAGEAWRWRVPMRVRNFADRSTGESLVALDLRRFNNAVVKLLGFEHLPKLRLVDPRAPGKALAVAGEATDGFHAVIDIPPRTELTLWLYAAAEAPADQQSPEQTFDSLVSGRLNLLRNGACEDGDGATPEAWASGLPVVAGADGLYAARVREGVGRSWGLKLAVPKTAGANWRGWRQSAKVGPSRTYLLSADCRAIGTAGNVRVHAHLHRADGSMTDSPFFSTWQAVAPSGEWTRTSAIVTTPADCATITVHLTMNSTGTLLHDNVLLTPLTPGVAGDVEARDARNAGFSVWPVNTLVKVFRYDAPPLSPASSATVSVCRNASRAVQLAVRASRAGDVRVECSALKGPGGAKLPAARLYRVGFVPVDFPVGYAGSEAPATHRLFPTHRGTDGWMGWWPDPLERVAAGETTPLTAGETQPFWVDVRAPADAVPGLYTGSVMFTASDARREVLPLLVRVWRPVLPKQRALPALYDLRSGHIRALDAGDMEQVLAWCRFLADYNVSPALCVVPPKFACKDGVVTMDASDFDRFCSYVIDELGVGRLYTPHIFYGCGWAYYPKKMFGFEAFSDEYVATWTSAYRQFTDHLKEKGWRDRFVYYLSDEPHESSDRTITGLARLADLARSVAPDVPVYSSTWRHIRGLDGHVNLWGIGIHGSFPRADVEARRKLGDRFWYTTDGHMCIDTPYLGVENLLPWFCAKYGCDAYEFWGVSWWTYDPWQYGWHRFIRQSSDGEKYRWVRYPNGDGYLAYPPRSGETGGEPVPSIRLLAAREGVDDYELMQALSARADKGDDAARGVLDRALALIDSPNRGGRYSTDIMPDPDAVLAARNAMGDTLDKPPRRGP